MKKVSIKKSVGLFYHESNSKARAWARRIERWIRAKHPSVRIDNKSPHALIVLGGDGTILDAARTFMRRSPILLGLNFGRVGFLASVREPKKFLSAIDQFLSGRYSQVKRMTFSVTVYRKNKKVFSTYALNDAAILSPAGLVNIETHIEGFPIQYVQGTGILVATSTGSTAYNLSAHGPIVMPDIKCLIITEILDHNIPTPSIVVKKTKEVVLKVSDFRERRLFKLAATDEYVDVMLVADGSVIFPLKKGDQVKVKRSPKLVRFAELEKNYFFKSLQEKFAFR